MWVPFAVIAAAILLPIMYVILTYNTLVALRNHIRDAWGNIDTELKRRYDLIPNLVATVKGYAAHEKEIFERVTQLRTQCMASEGAVNKQADESQLVDALQKLLAVVVNNPTELDKETASWGWWMIRQTQSLYLSVSRRTLERSRNLSNSIGNSQQLHISPTSPHHLNPNWQSFLRPAHRQNDNRIASQTEYGCIARTCNKVHSGIASSST